MNTISITELLQKPVCMMSGEELYTLLKNLLAITHDDKPKEEPGPHNVYGVAGIAKIFGCSVPTASRIKASGVIDGAITQVKRKIIVDVDKAIELAKSAAKSI